MRVIKSTLQNLDIDEDREEDFVTAVEAGDLLRETYSKDGLGQKTYHIRLVAYTDPDGAHRFVTAYDSEADVDWMDTDNHPEAAIQSYEELVRGEAECVRVDEDGNERPPFDYTDVSGVDGCNEGADEVGNKRAAMQAAEWAHQEFLDVERGYQSATRRRQLAFAQAIDSYGRGGQASLSHRVDLSEPTVKAIAARGRATLPSPLRSR